MGRNTIRIHRDLERYLPDLMDEVDRCLNDQEDHRERAISRLKLKAENIYELAAKIFEALVFDEDCTESKAVDDASIMAVNTAIYAGLDRDRALRDIPEDLEDEITDDYEDAQELTGGSRRGRGRDDDRRDRSDRSNRSRRGGRDTRRVAAEGGRDDYDDRGRDDRGRGRDDRDEEARELEIRRARREGREPNLPEERQQERNTRPSVPRGGRREEQQRDQVVETAQRNLETNAEYEITSDLLKSNPGPFCGQDKTLPIAPVYWLGSQVPLVINDNITFKRADNNVKWEEHRTDLFLQVRKHVAPSASVRDDALARAAVARNRYIDETIDKMKDKANVVEEGKPTEVKQVLTSDMIAGKFYGLGSPMAKIQSGLANMKLRYLPSHPVIMKVEQYPMWVMNKELTEAMQDFVKMQDLNLMMPKLLAVSNACSPEQWAWFHDKLTQLINLVLKVELEAEPYLNSVVTEWSDFTGWLDHTGQVTWFINNFPHFLERRFHIYKHGSEMASQFVDGTDQKYASVSITQNFIYLPTDSENFGAASATKLGRVLESVTPKLYKLLADNISTDSENMLVTSSDESVSVYRRVTNLGSAQIFMGDVTW